jgi:hypothetical protein
VAAVQLRYDRGGKLGDQYLLDRAGDAVRRVDRRVATAPDALPNR